jgi:hypothetical protein
VLAALLKAVEITAIFCHQDHPASTLAGDPNKGETALRPRLANVDYYDVVVVILDRTVHFAASLECRE